MKSKPKSGKRVSARSNRTAKAAVAKKAAVALGKEFASGDQRHRRIAGQTPAAWSQADPDYVKNSCPGKKQGRRPSLGAPNPTTYSRQLQNRYFSENCKLREPIDVFTTPVGMLAV